MKFLIICLAIIICYLTNESTSKNKSKDASKTGKKFKIVNNHILKGKLKKDRNGKYIESEIDLTHLIANRNGKLEFIEIGDYQKTCSNCEVDKKLNLKCVCEDKDGKPVKAKLNLGRSIINDHGKFSFVPLGFPVKITANNHKA